MTQHVLGIASAKTRKGEPLGYLTGICYLAPATEAGIPGFNACPWAGNCKNVCLYSAGRGAFNSVQKARINKTKFFHQDREGFLNQARKDIKALVRKATRTGMKPCIRLDGTSDIGIALLQSKATGLSLVQEFPSIQFYDYTKSFSRMRKFLEGGFPPNYHLTFSYDGSSNIEDSVKVLRRRGNVAVVFRKELPSLWIGYEVVDGDLHDLRFQDPNDRGYIIGLKAKGKAKNDRSGFVVDVLHYGV